MTAIDSDPDEAPPVNSESEPQADDAVDKSVGALRTEALARRQRLKDMRVGAAKLRQSCGTNRDQQKLTDELGGGGGGEEEDETELPKPIFRNYKPQSDVLKQDILPAAETVDLTKFITSQLEAANAPSLVEEVNLLSLAPRKPDWDLKRGVEKKLAKLDRRTQRVIGELIRERLRDSQADLASVVNQQPGQL